MLNLRFTKDCEVTKGLPQQTADGKAIFCQQDAPCYKPCLGYRAFGIFFALFVCLWLATSAQAQQITIVSDVKQTEIAAHGLEELKSALAQKKIDFEIQNNWTEKLAETVIVATTGKLPADISERSLNKPDPVPGALSIWATVVAGKKVLVVQGSDSQGLMYGLLDVAERIKWTHKGEPILNQIQDVKERPAIAERAVSVYTMNRRYWETRLYDQEYWKQYFDLLAQNRFNMFTIIFGYENGGFLAPCYPYFFDVDGYQQVKMNGITQIQQENNLAAMNRLIGMAHERGIKITLGIWDHIYRGGIQAGDMGDGKAAPAANGVIVTGLTSDNLIPYTEAALNKLIEKMPGIDAIQFRMHGESGLRHGEQRPFWKRLFASIKKNHPALRLVLRAKDLPDEIIQDAIESGVSFSIGTKFWMEQTGLPFSPTQIYKQDQKNRRHGYANLLHQPQAYKMAWRIWTGGTNRILTWGDPDYVSRLIKSLDIFKNGNYAVEVNEMLATKMEAQPHDEEPFELLATNARYYKYEFERYWDFYMSYGRMSYNPDTEIQVWEKVYQNHFGKTAGTYTRQAVHLAAKILPRIVASCYNYSFFPTTRGWAEKQRIGNLDEYARSQGSDVAQFANFQEQANILLTGGETAKILPSTNAVWFSQIADSVQLLINKAEYHMGNKPSKEFKATMVDLRILSKLALYHARRIPAAVYYNIYEKTDQVAALDSAISCERRAIDAWMGIIKAAGQMYGPDLKFGPAHTGFEGVAFEQSGHWKDELHLLEADLARLVKKSMTIKASSQPKAIPIFPASKDVTNAKYFTISHHPVTEAAAGNDILIRVKVNSDTSLQWIKLRHRAVNQYLDFETITMEPGPEKYTYQATIPVKAIDPKYDLMYFFEIMDIDKRGFIYPDLNKETPYVVVHLKR